MTTETSRHRKKHGTHDHYDLTVAIHKVAWRAREWAEECRHRTHMAAGTHYASPRFGQERHTFRGGVKREVALAAQRQLARSEKGRRLLVVGRRANAAKGAIGRFRKRPVRTVVRSVERLPYVGQAVSVVRIAFWALLMCMLLIGTLWYGWIYPRVYTFMDSPLGAVPDAYGRLDDFDEFLGDRPIIPGLPWGGIIPGSYEQCAGIQPVAEKPQPKGGIEGIAYGFGNLIKRALDVEPSPEGVRDAVHSAAFNVGKGWTVFTRAVQGVMPEPTVASPAPHLTPMHPVPPGVGGGILGTPIDASQPLTDEQVAALALEVGWPAEEVTSGRLGARVLAESGNDPRARDYVDGSHQGLLQLGQAEQAAYLTPGASVFDPRANLEAGLRLWQARGWQPWRASDAGHVQYLERARAAAAGTDSTAASFVEAGTSRTITNGGGDPLWFMDLNPEAQAVHAAGGALVQPDPSGFLRMWTQAPVTGPFTVSFQARVTGWGSTGLNGNVQPGLKFVAKVPHPAAPAGPEGVRGQDPTPGSYNMPIATRNGETYISRLAPGGGYEFWSQGSRSYALGQWRQVQISVEPAAGGTRVRYLLDGQVAAEHVDTSGALDGLFYPGLRSDGAAWEVRGFQVNGGVVDCAPAGGVQLAAGVPDAAAEAELSQNAIRARRAVLAAFPGTTIGGWGERPNNTQHDDRDPVTGRKAAKALDIMNATDAAGMAKGQRVNEWLLAHWDELRVDYVIWDRRIYSAPERSRPYTGRSPHEDHNHVSFLPDGGQAA